MWDVDDSGSINVTEMTNIIATMDDVEGVEQEPKVMLINHIKSQGPNNCVLSRQASSSHDSAPG